MGYKRPGYLAQIWLVFKWKICRRRFLRQVAVAAQVPLEVLTGKKPRKRPQNRKVTHKNG